ncbi:hypothetical protein OsI_05120 [Oryza sativa Indica Group]|uniref:Uncharacterized protein n=1 Tax=Oryza sativa subsp. indica TaxID=39946 RepID=A2WYV8_ORYSI|nr:hypothetical protein OsI_05120 [Oryza sativa Indica Group]
MASARARGGRAFFLLVLVLVVLAAPAAALRTSAISAAPEYPRLPTGPGHGGGRHAAPAPAAVLPPAPALSPDIMPLLPSPGPDSDGSAEAPSDVMPTIPSSPSPPNPDALLPDSALAPFGSAPAVSAQSRAPPPSTTTAAAAAWALPVAVGLVAMWLV